VILPRLIPVLLLDHRGLLVKTVRFGRPRYIGDPVNAVRIFNDKGVDELFVMDIAAARSRRPPRLDLIRDIVSEAFMPVGYGGGLASIEDIRATLRVGVEKIILNSAAFEQPGLIEAASGRFGAQAVVVSVDYKKSLFRGERLALRGATRTLAITPDQAVERAVAAGAGEILLMSVDRDGTMQGYDIETVRRIAAATPVPVVACGGAGTIADVRRVLDTGGVSAAAAGSLFVYFGRRRAVLINAPEMVEAVGRG
jgi:cyclase